MPKLPSLDDLKGAIGGEPVNDPSFAMALMPMLDSFNHKSGAVNGCSFDPEACLVPHHTHSASNPHATPTRHTYAYTAPHRTAEAGGPLPRHFLGTSWTLPRRTTEAGGATRAGPAGMHAAAYRRPVLRPTAAPHTACVLLQANAFVLTAGAPLRRGEEAYISYGDKGNDALLQLFGFVEAFSPARATVNGSCKEGTRPRKEWIRHPTRTTPSSPSAFRSTSLRWRATASAAAAARRR